MKKRIISLLMTVVMAASLVACGSSDAASTDGSASGDAAATTTEAAASTDEVAKPESLKIMVSGDLAANQENGQDAFIAEFEKLTGIKLEIIQPDHSAYYDVLGTTMASGDIPDLVYLGSTYYASYANEGLLWDMTDAYANSELKARHDAKGSGQVVDSVRIDGKLYGMPAWKGGGCVTYVRQAWLDAAGISVPTTYAEYVDMLKAFKELGLEGQVSDYVTGAAGFIGGEAPYINYLPEVYQDAYPTFVQQADGTWVDGFTQDSMKAALQRLADLVADGLIDKQTLDQSTKDARTKFMGGEYGAFTYWANHWATNLTKGMTEDQGAVDLVPMAPIKEVGTYINRLSPVWCITSACSNPEGAFKYFIETMQDGGDVQFLWTYGVEGTHYSYAAETLWAGTDNEKAYEEGKFHWLPTMDDPSKAFSKIHCSTSGADRLVDITSASHEDPNAMAEEAVKATEVFSANSRNEALTPSTDAYVEYNGDLTTLKNELIAKVATGELTVDAAYEQFASQGQAMSDSIVESLNALN